MPINSAGLSATDQSAVAICPEGNAPIIGRTAPQTKFRYHYYGQRDLVKSYWGKKWSNVSSGEHAMKALFIQSL